MLAVPPHFIRRYWQKKPLLLRDAMPGIKGLVKREDLLAIACQPEAEARLVMADAEQKNWQCEEGPFKAKQLRALPASHWTLLVQAVDQWLPDVAALLKQFDFLPRWRLDDIMISCATTGGGVGPHFDYYDVFLLQASGTRRWQLGQRCDDASPLREHTDLKLLKQFRKTTDYTLQTGDILYIPPGVAHWGTAMDDDCITISIGFRAASQRELVQMALSKIASTLPESRRYIDTPAAIDTDPFCINKSAITQLIKDWKKLDAGQITAALTQALGEYATELRYPDQIEAGEAWSLADINRYLENKKVKSGAFVSLVHNPVSRFAYHALDNSHSELYVDGETHHTSVKLAQAICHAQLPASLLRKADDKQLLLTLLNNGSVVLA